MSFILGKKIGMTRMFDEDGRAVPLTVISAGPITVTQIKTKSKDGYEAVQFGYENTKRVSKPISGHLKNGQPFKYLREYMLEDEAIQNGATIDVSAFAVGDIVKVTAISKGKGFQGAVKRHGFHGMPASHGHHHVLRHVGSIGQRWPQHTLKGMRMAGRMGGDTTTTRGLRVVAVDAEHNMLGLNGAVPGKKGGLVEIVKL